MTLHILIQESQIAVHSLCAFGCIFATSNLFVDAEILPKWLCLWMGIGIWCLVSAAGLLSGRGFGDGKDLRKQLAAVIALFGTCQAICGFALPTRGLAMGSFDNTAGFAACLCAALPCCLLFLHERRLLWKMLGGMMSLMVMTGIAWSHSRAGWLAMAVVLMVHFRKEVFRRKGRLSRAWQWGAGVVCATVLVGSLYGVYLFKKDSADGRLLIWRCALEIVADKPLLGHGPNAVECHYMDYQAAYLEAHPESPYLLLADNVKHLYNEYLEILVRYGLVGLLLLAVFVFSFFRCYKQTLKQHSEGLRYLHLAGEVLAGIAVFAFFSYPLTYPFTWIMMTFSVCLLVSPVYGQTVVAVVERNRLLLVCGLIAASAVIISRTVRRAQAEIEWNTISSKVLFGNASEMLKEYGLLMPKLGNNPYFLYNYAAELHLDGKYSSADSIIGRCQRLWADYDLELLQGINNMGLGRYAEAEKHLQTAAQMVPSKFEPHYQLFLLYQKKGDDDASVRKGKEIISKPVKLMTKDIEVICKEVKDSIYQTYFYQ